jgi:aspartate racemase
MPQHIGIVACSAEGAAFCYRTICEEGERFLGPHGHPEVSMHTPSLAEYVKCFNCDDWQSVGELMLASANKLAQIGADFLICPDNTIHQGLPYIDHKRFEFSVANTEFHLFACTCAAAPRGPRWMR